MAALELRSQREKKINRKNSKFYREMPLHAANVLFRGEMCVEYDSRDSRVTGKNV